MKVLKILLALVFAVFVALPVSQAQISVSEKASALLEELEGERPLLCLAAYDEMLAANETYQSAFGEYKRLDDKIKDAKRKERKALKAQKEEMAKAVFRGQNSLRTQYGEAVNKAKYLCYKPDPILFQEEAFSKACASEAYRSSDICQGTQTAEKLPLPEITQKPTFSSVMGYIENKSWEYAESSEAGYRKYKFTLEMRTGNLSAQMDLFVGGIRTANVGEGHEEDFMDYIDNSGFFLPGAPKNIFTPELEFLIRHQGLPVDSSDIRIAIVGNPDDLSSSSIRSTPFYTFIDGVFSFHFLLNEAEWDALKKSTSIQVIVGDKNNPDAPLMVANFSSQNLVENMRALETKLLESIK